jgi:hypothetical protein
MKDLSGDTMMAFQSLVLVAPPFVHTHAPFYPRIYKDPDSKYCSPPETRVCEDHYHMQNAQAS